MYSKKVIEYFTHPRNTGVMKNPDSKSTEGSLACGDMIHIYLKVNPKTLVIKDIKFQSYGCAANIATTSIMTEMVKGKTLEKAKKLTFKDIEKVLGGLPPTKIHCSVLAIDGLMSAIRNYEEKHGLAKPEELTESLIRSRLRHVIYPSLGKDIVTLGLVKKVQIQNDVIRLDLSLKRDNEFYGNVTEDIQEKIGYMPGVKKVETRLV